MRGRMNHPGSPRKSNEQPSSSEHPIWGSLLVTTALKPHSLEKDTTQGALGCPSILSGESTWPGFCILGPDANACSQFSGRVSQPLALPASSVFTSSTSPPRPLLNSSVPGLLPPVPGGHFSPSLCFFQSSHLFPVNRFYLHLSISHVLICPSFYKECCLTFNSWLLLPPACKADTSHVTYLP